MYFSCFRGVSLFSSTVSVKGRMIAMWTAWCSKKVRSPPQIIQSSLGKVNSQGSVHKSSSLH